MNQIPPSDPNAAETGTNPMAIASVVLSVVGVVTYCCGSFVCLGWIAPVFWVVGAILGGVAMSQGGSGKTLGIVGLLVNGMFLLLFIGLMVVGVGFGLLSGMMGAMQGGGY